MIRAGILGAGYIARAHARGYAALPGDRVRLVAVADRHPERAAELAALHGARPVDSLEALLELGLDAVSICTGTTSHAPAAVAALRAGCHVLCEKPLARTVPEAEEMIRVAGETGARLMVGHVCRFEAEHLRATELLAQGALGTLRFGLQAITAPWPDWNPGWYSDPAQSGGPVLDLAIHSIDSLMWWFGQRVVRVCAVGSRPAGGLVPYAQLSLRFEDGGLALVETSWVQPRAQGLQLRTELVGTEGRLEWDYAAISSMQIVDDRAGRRDLVMAGEDSYAAQIAAFCDCIERQVPPPIAPEAGLAALRVALAGLESLRTGQPAGL